MPTKTKYAQRKATMGSTNGKKSKRLASVPEKDDETHGNSVNEDTASTAIASITANIAATSITMTDIDLQPIIEEERTPEDTSALVRFKKSLEVNDLRLTVTSEKNFTGTVSKQEQKTKDGRIIIPTTS